MITLKNLQVSDSLSEETTALTCDVYWNGRKVAHARNRGNGECTHVMRLDAKDDLGPAEAFAATKPVVLLDGSPLMIDGKPAMHDLGSYIDELAEDMHHAKKVRASIQRLMKTKTVFIDGMTVYTTKQKYTEQVGDLVRKKHSNAVVLNGLPIEKAVALVMEADRLAAKAERNVQEGQG